MLKLNKLDATMQECLVRENHIYHELMTKHPLSGWKCYKHNNRSNNNNIINLMKSQRAHTLSPRDQPMRISISSQGSL